LGQAPLATGVTIYDVSLSPALTQLYVNVPAGPWTSYRLVISRELGTPAATSPPPSSAAAQAQAGPGLIAPMNGRDPANDVAVVGPRPSGAAARFPAPYQLASFTVSLSDVQTTKPITLTVKLDRSADEDIPIRLFLDRALINDPRFVVPRGSDTATTLFSMGNTPIGNHFFTVRLAGEPGDDSEELTREVRVYDHLPAWLAS
jgi:hypothetical protein